MATTSLASTSLASTVAGPEEDSFADHQQRVQELLEASAYFSLFSVPNPDEPDVPILAQLPFPFSLVQRLPYLSQLFLAGVKVNEGPLRFVVRTEEASCQLLATNQVGQEIASVHIQWMPIPWDYRANPDANPPQTILNPLVSQRFEMLNGHFGFKNGSGFRAFGSGHTFPNFPRGLSLKIGAVINILQGEGELAGTHATVVVNGEITPPKDLALNLMIRILDPPSGIRTTAPLPPLKPRKFPDPGATFMMFQSEPDPHCPTTLRRRHDGTIIGLELAEILRPVDLDFDLVGDGLKSRVVTGPIVGRARSTLSMPLDSGGCCSAVPLSAMTRNGTFTFHDHHGRELGTVEANLVEGRGFPTPLAGAPTPIYRVGGFGPILRGSGQFRGFEGMLTLNGAFSLFPRAFSNLYIFRFVDPDGRLRPVGSDQEAAS